MADTKVSALDTLGSVDRTTDLLYVVDASGPTSNKMTINSALGFSGGNPVSTTDSQTLTNKTLTSPTINTPTLTVNDDSFTLQDNADTTKKAVFQLSGITTGNTRTLTIPDASTTLVGTGVTQTLTNKTLTSPTINNPTLNVDTISEFTSANGVSIDGLLIKDGLLPAGNIQPLNLVSGTGSSWAWQSWTPTLTNLSGGTLNYSKYIQIGKTVFFKLKYTLAGAGIAGSVSFTLPVTSTGAANEPISGDVIMLDTGTAGYIGCMIFSNTTTALVQASNTAGTYAANVNLSSTVPHTWANTDVISLAGFYEAA